MLVPFITSWNQNNLRLRKEDSISRNYEIESKRMVDGEVPKNLPPLFGDLIFFIEFPKWRMVKVRFAEFGCL